LGINFCKEYETFKHSLSSDLFNNSIESILKICALFNQKKSPLDYYEMYLSVTESLSSLSEFIKTNQFRRFSYSLEKESSEKAKIFSPINDSFNRLYLSIDSYYDLIPRNYVLLTLAETWQKVHPRPFRILDDLMFCLKSNLSPLSALFQRFHFLKVFKNTFKDQKLFFKEKCPGSSCLLSYCGGRARKYYKYHSLLYLFENLEISLILLSRYGQFSSFKDKSLQDKNRENLHMLIGENISIIAGFLCFSEEIQNNLQNEITTIIMDKTLKILKSDVFFEDENGFEVNSTKFYLTDVIFNSFPILIFSSFDLSFVYTNFTKNNKLGDFCHQNNLISNLFERVRKEIPDSFKDFITISLDNCFSSTILLDSLSKVRILNSFYIPLKKNFENSNNFEGDSVVIFEKIFNKLNQTIKDIQKASIDNISLKDSNKLTPKEEEFFNHAKIWANFGLLNSDFFIDYLNKVFRYDKNIVFESIQVFLHKNLNSDDKIKFLNEKNSDFILGLLLSFYESNNIFNLKENFNEENLSRFFYFLHPNTINSNIQKVFNTLLSSKPTPLYLVILTIQNLRLEYLIAEDVSSILEASKDLAKTVFCKNPEVGVEIIFSNLEYLFFKYLEKKEKYEIVGDEKFLQKVLEFFDLWAHYIIQENCVYLELFLVKSKLIFSKFTTVFEKIILCSFETLLNKVRNIQKKKYVILNTIALLKFYFDFICDYEKNKLGKKDFKELITKSLSDSFNFTSRIIRVPDRLKCLIEIFKLIIVEKNFFIEENADLETNVENEIRELIEDCKEEKEVKDEVVLEIEMFENICKAK